MKKTYSIAISLSLMISFLSCDDFFDVQPTTYIEGDAAWTDENTISAILADAYARITYEDFGYFEGFWVFTQLNLSSASDESYPSWQQGEFGVGGRAQVVYGDSWFYVWPYDQIRSCNDIMQKIDASGIDTEKKEQIKAEVRFIRAFHYFHLVKRFGGVPLIKEVQKYNPNHLEDLEAPREKEQVIWDFIAAELDEIAPLLPKSRPASDRNRANRNMAHALKSRAMLYAAAIAKYGAVDLDGLVGIAANPAPYWKAAAVAADSVINSGNYSLYNKYPDKAENYNQLFLDKNNGEYIWTKEFSLPDISHSFDFMTTPYSFTSGYGCGLTPTLELVEAYEYTDGTAGTLKTVNGSTPVKYDHPLDLFAGKDPRLFASIYLPMSPFKGSVVEIRRGVYREFNQSFHAATNLHSKTTLASGTQLTVGGKDGIMLTGDPTKSGFYQKKFYDEKRIDFSEGKSDQTWPVFRLAEMYLNKAEAEMELGDKTKAVDALNKIRERAGIKTLAENEITLNSVRNERRIELVFEGHRFWDLRRWRLAAKGDTPGSGILDPGVPSALWPWVVYDDGKYIFTKVSGSSTVQKPDKVFFPRHYYLKFKSEEINSNRKLIQNPGY